MRHPTLQCAAPSAIMCTTACEMDIQTGGEVWQLSSKRSKDLDPDPDLDPNPDQKWDGCTQVAKGGTGRGKDAGRGLTVQQQPHNTSSQSTLQHTSPVAQQVAGIWYFLRIPARSCTTMTWVRRCASGRANDASGAKTHPHSFLAVRMNHIRAVEIGRCERSPARQSRRWTGWLKKLATPCCVAAFPQRR